MRLALSFTLAGAWVAALGTTPRAAGMQSGRAEVAFEAASRKELVDGDLKGAIALYQEVVAGAGDNPRLAAKALVHLGQCYENLGDSRLARKAYHRVLREYSKQSLEAAAARKRLAAMDGPKKPKRKAAESKPDSPS